MKTKPKEGNKKMERKTKVVGLIAVVAIVAVVMFAGCVEEGETAKPTDQTELLATAVRSSVYASTESWDADAEDDGIVIYPSLWNKTDNTVRFRDIELPVEIKIYTVKSDDDYNEIKDRLVYDDVVILNTWEEGFISTGYGIKKIPYEDINTIESDDDYGWVYTTITLPDGRKMEAVDKFARIKPE